jgi:hypothetical protein
MLQPFLKAVDARLRASAAGALGKIPTESSVSALVAALEDPDGRTRAAAVNALGRVGGGRAEVVSELVRRLDDPDTFVRDRALIALARLQGEAAEALVLGDNAMRAAPPVMAIALALVGTDAAVSRAAALVSFPGTTDAVHGAVVTEDDEVRRIFATRLTGRGAWWRSTARCFGRRVTPASGGSLSKRSPTPTTTRPFSCCSRRWRATPRRPCAFAPRRPSRSGPRT